MNEPNLQGLMADIALIRASLETQTQFPPDDPARGEMLELVWDARRNLVQYWRELVARRPTDLGMSTGMFKDAVINLMLTGLSQDELDFLKNRVKLGEADTLGTRYLYEFAPWIDVFMAQALPAEELFTLFIADIRESAENIENYASKRRFDRAVFMKVLALLFAIESAGGRLDRRDDGGQEEGAPVPREPIEPQLTGEAAEAIPDRMPAEIDAVSVPVRSER